MKQNESEHCIFRPALMSRLELLFVRRPLMAIPNGERLKRGERREGSVSYLVGGETSWRLAPCFWSRTRMDSLVEVARSELLMDV
jgi:hypothetical protein